MYPSSKPLVHMLGMRPEFQQVSALVYYATASAMGDMATVLELSQFSMLIATSKRIRMVDGWSRWRLDRGILSNNPKPVIGVSDKKTMEFIMSSDIDRTISIYMTKFGSDLSYGAHSDQD